MPCLALQSADAVIALILCAFAAWGAWRGSLRQLGAILVFVAAFPLALRFGPRVETTVAKVVSVSGFELRAVSWAVVYAAAVIAGGALLTVLQPWLIRVRLGGPVERPLGAALGVVQGALFLTVVGFGALLAGAGAASPPWIANLEGSASGAAMNGIRRGLTSVVELPPWLAERVSDAAERIES